MVIAGQKSPSHKNVAAKYVSTLEDWEGLCGELVDELLHAHPEGDILWVDNPIFGWRYHMALILDGRVHDPWYVDLVLPPDQYVEAAFGPNITWEINP